MNIIKKRAGLFNYTRRHRRAFLETEIKLRGFNSARAKWHDFDKLFLYWLPIPKKWIQAIHRFWSPHHLECPLPKSFNDYLMTIIDWECARITKPDKPLNAYETYLKFYKQKYPGLWEFLEPAFKKLGLDWQIHD